MGRGAGERGKSVTPTGEDVNVEDAPQFARHRVALGEREGPALRRHAGEDGAIPDPHEVLPDAARHPPGAAAALRPRPEHSHVVRLGVVLVHIARDPPELAQEPQAEAAEGGEPEEGL